MRGTGGIQELIVSFVILRTDTLAPKDCRELSSFLSHILFPLQRKFPLSSPFSSFTMDLIVEKEKERQVEVKSDQDVLSLHFKLFLGLQ